MFCTNCGNEVAEGHAFCANCGAPLISAPAEESPSNVKVEVNYNVPSQVVQTPSYYIPKRSIVLAIILTIITCGIYGLYWICKINNEVNAISGNMHATSGGLVIVLTLITCGIYGLFWHFFMGERLDDACANFGLGYGGERGILYLLLAIFSLGIVSMALEQHSLNKLVDAFIRQ